MQDTVKTEWVNTHQLREGDLVRNHGMLIRLGEVRKFDGQNDREVWHFPGVVENYEQVIAADPGIRGHIRDGRYAVQGNDLADWVRVIEQ